MKVMIPMKNVDEIGVRDIISTQRRRAFWRVFASIWEKGLELEQSGFVKTWRSSKSGNILEVLEVVKNPDVPGQEKGTFDRRKMLSTQSRF